jgi:hypothetical protein
MRLGCEIGMYPYVIPFSGAAFARDPSLKAHTEYHRRVVAGTNVSWDQPAKILPIDPMVKDIILRIETSFEGSLAALEKDVAHLPSRIRSLLWISSAIPILAEHGHFIARESEVRADLYSRLPAFQQEVTPLAAATV